MYTRPTPDVDKLIKPSSALTALFTQMEAMFGAPAIEVVKSMLQSAIYDEDVLLIPTEEHPFLVKDLVGNYKAQPLPDGHAALIGEALHHLIDRPENVRILLLHTEGCLSIFYNPYKGGLTLRYLLSVPGGGDPGSGD